MMSANDYPKFSRSDIITVLREANIASVKDADLKNPTFDSVSDLYTRILIYLDVLTEYVFLSLIDFYKTLISPNLGIFSNFKKKFTAEKREARLISRLWSNWRIQITTPLQLRLWIFTSNSSTR